MVLHYILSLKYYLVLPCFFCTFCVTSYVTVVQFCVSFCDVNIVTNCSCFSFVLRVVITDVQKQLFNSNVGHYWIYSILEFFKVYLILTALPACILKVIPEIISILCATPDCNLSLRRDFIEIRLVV